MAQLIKKPVVIQEQNSFAGKTNKLLAAKAKSICVAYEGMEKFFPQEKIKLTGNPVRKDIYDHKVNRSRAFKHFELDESKKTLLILGGSLGARAINDAVVKCIEDCKENDIQLLWQTGKFYFQELQHFNSASIRVKDFVYKMDYAYSIADLVISRAGALSVSELCLSKKPTILIPSPNVAEDHQTKNAEALVNEDAAVLLKDDLAKEGLRSQVFALIRNDKKLKELSNNIAHLGKPNAAKEIAIEIIKQV